MSDTGKTTASHSSSPLSPPLCIFSFFPMPCFNDFFSFNTYRPSVLHQITALCFFMPPIKSHSLCFLPFHSLSVALYLSLLFTCSLLECQHEEMPVFLYPSFRKTPIFPKAPHPTTITNNNSDSQKATLVRPLAFTSSEKTN